MGYHYCHLFVQNLPFIIIANICLISSEGKIKKSNPWFSRGIEDAGFNMFEAQFTFPLGWYSEQNFSSDEQIARENKKKKRLISCNPNRSIDCELCTFSVWSPMKQENKNILDGREALYQNKSFHIGDRRVASCHMSL